MKFSFQALAACAVGIVALLSQPQAHSAPIAVGIEAFTSSSTVVDFDSISDEAQITTEYSALGVTFTGALFGMTNLGDTQLFNGSTIGSNWIYEVGEAGVSQGPSWTATFDTAQNRVGFFAETNGADGVTIETYLGGILTGSVFFSNPEEISPNFIGVQDSDTFDRITVTTQTNDNGFFAMDDFRFEDTASVSVPDGGTTFALLGIGLSGIGWVRGRK